MKEGLELIIWLSTNLNEVIPIFCRCPSPWGNTGTPEQKTCFHVLCFALSLYDHYDSMYSDFIQQSAQSPRVRKVNYSEAIAPTVESGKGTSWKWLCLNSEVYIQCLFLGCWSFDSRLTFLRLASVSGRMLSAQACRNLKSTVVHYSRLSRPPKHSLAQFELNPTNTLLSIFLNVSCVSIDFVPNFVDLVLVVEVISVQLCVGCFVISVWFKKFVKPNSVLCNLTSLGDTSSNQSFL